MEQHIQILSGERIDNIGFNDMKLIQKPEEFCYGIDAVILAYFAAKVPTRAADHKFKKTDNMIIDLGTGTGIIPIILSQRTQAKKIIGVEVQKDSYQRAVRNSQMNGLEGRVEFINGDVVDVEKNWGIGLASSADTVTSNPPYTINSGGLTNSNWAKSVARHETTAGLEDFIKCAAFLLRDKGDFFMVHRPSRLVDICCFGRENSMEPKELCFISPNKNSKPNIVLVHMVKGGGKELKMLEPLYVYDDNGEYTGQIREIYK